MILSSKVFNSQKKKKKYFYCKNIYGFGISGSDLTLNIFLKNIITVFRLKIKKILYIFLERRQVSFFGLKNLKKNQKNRNNSQTSSHPVPAPVLKIDANAGLSDMLRQIQLLGPTILNRRDRPILLPNTHQLLPVKAGGD